MGIPINPHIEIMAARLEAEKFTGKNDYGLWKMKMRAVLVKQGLAAVLLREIQSETTAAGILKRLDEVYLA